MKKVAGVFLIIVIFLSSSCIFGPTSRRVMSYRYHRVFLSGPGRDNYSVGELPEGWKKVRVQAHAIAFHNAKLGATIATDAFCGPAYEDIELRLLTTHLTAGVDSYEVKSQDEFMLDDRGALRTVISGRVDGVPLMFDIVVIKKNKCNIDFMCIVPESGYTEAAVDFGLFYRGFHYEDGTLPKRAMYGEQASIERLEIGTE